MVTKYACFLFSCAFAESNNIFLNEGELTSSLSMKLNLACIDAKMVQKDCLLNVLYGIFLHY